MVCHNPYVGTVHRNHCPFCLYSKHVDEKTAGDRKSECQAKMVPIGLTFKKDSPLEEKEGELMLIHRCSNCGKISINRIAGDDFQDEILEIFKRSKGDEELRKKLEAQNIKLLGSQDETEIKAQLFGIS